MKSLNEYIDVYRKQMEKGDIRIAYQSLMNYMMDLRTYLKNKYPEYTVSGMYFGYMDMTYFSFSPESLKSKKIKIAIVLIHQSVSFEVWLAGVNKQVQGEFWKLFRESGWNSYHIPATIKGADSIVEGILEENPDFNDPRALNEKIERGTITFIEEITVFLSKYPDV